MGVEAVKGAGLSDRARAAALLRRTPHLHRKPKFREWTERYVPRYIWYRHCVLLSEYLERLIHGDLRELFVFEPPRHGKSELVSRTLPPYYLYLWPERWVGLSSYNANLAATFSRTARSRFVGVLSGESAAAMGWETAKRGGMWAAGVGGTQTGRGGNLLICDDPVKDASEAESPLIQQRNADWWDSVWGTRLEPDGAKLTTLTRWHGNDVGGHAMRSLGDNMDGIAVVHLPAIAEERADVEKLYEAYPGVELAPDWRKPGEALCPERFPVHVLARRQKTMTDYFWSALFQQRPSVRGGAMFPRSMAKIVPTRPTEGVRLRIRYWDKAGTEGGGARSAGVRLALVGRGDQQRVVVEDVVTGQWASLAREEVIKTTAKLDGRTVHVRIEQEPGSGGKESAESTIRNLGGHRIKADRPTGDKTLRADPIAAQWQGGNVSMVEGPWNERFLSELENFPTGTFRDQADALSGAYNCLMALAGSKKLVGPLGGPRYPSYSV